MHPIISDMIFNKKTNSGTHYNHNGKSKKYERLKNKYSAILGLKHHGEDDAWSNKTSSVYRNSTIQ